ncbi:septal ring lytic transglycosylase RlpA family protein [cyanobiont of Ornithocercus magnificus]|nr:septal ring lytic transglycosylase RlpA family protein [cyanobiont of Ornithocercus magnificus]
MIPGPPLQLASNCCVAGNIALLSLPAYSFGCEASRHADTTRLAGEPSKVLENINLSSTVASSVSSASPSTAMPVSVLPLWYCHKQQVVQTLVGKASWYGPGFFGRQTVTGEVFRPGTMTAAHRSLPLGTRVRVTNFSNSRSVVVRINDRGPYISKRIIDLAHGAACELGLVRSGIAQVRVEVLH